MDNLPLLKTKDFSGIGDIHLILGRGCNMNCRHCIQHPFRQMVDECRISSDVFRMIDNYVSYCRTEKDDDNRLKYVFFWGGEPLLYWNLVKKIIVFLTDKYDLLNFKRFRFVITTNGLALTEEIVDFINKYNVVVNFSYDAPYPFAVRGYVSDKICNLVKQIDCYSVLGNACAYNCDYLLAYRCLKAKFPNADGIKVGFNTFASFDVDADILKFDFSKIKDSLRKVRISAQLGDKFSLRFLKEMFVDKHGAHEELLCTSGLWTGMKNLPVTLDGKIMVCHNGDICVGTVNDSRISIANKVKERAHNRNSIGKCNSCRHKDLCNGYCQLETKNEDGSYFACNNFLIPFYDSVKSELRYLCKPLSDEDLTWFHKQEEAMEEQVKKFLLEGERYEKEHTRLPSDMMWHIGVK